MFYILCRGLDNRKDLKSLCFVFFDKGIDMTFWDRAAGFLRC